jgi:hypothetical protein
VRYSEINLSTITLLHKNNKNLTNCNFNIDVDRIVYYRSETVVTVSSEFVDIGYNAKDRRVDSITLLEFLKSCDYHAHAIFKYVSVDNGLLQSTMNVVKSVFPICWSESYYGSGSYQTVVAVNLTAIDQIIFSTADKHTVPRDVSELNCLSQELREHSHLKYQLPSIPKTFVKVFLAIIEHISDNNQPQLAELWKAKVMYTYFTNNISPYKCNQKVNWGVLTASYLLNCLLRYPSLLLEVTFCSSPDVLLSEEDEVCRLRAIEELQEIVGEGV